MTLVSRGLGAVETWKGTKRSRFLGRSTYILCHVVACAVAKQPPRGEGWAHELKHDGHRLQIHIRDGRVKLYSVARRKWGCTIRRAPQSVHGSHSGRLRL